MIAQADGGRYAAGDDPQAASRACETVSETSRSALAEMRRLPPEELLAAIRTVHRGDAVIAPSTTRRLLDHVAPMLREEGPDAGPHVLESLTNREREVLSEMAYGLSNSEIAERFVLSEATVKTHVGHIVQALKSGTGSRPSSLPTRPAWSSLDRATIRSRRSVQL